MLLDQGFLIRESNMKFIPLFLNTFVRLLVPLLVFSHPGLTAVLVLLLDTIDAQFYLLADLSFKIYHRLDKFLDLYWYFFIFFYSLVYKPLSPVFFLIILFFLIRLCGDLFFYITGKRRVFLFFPNLLEPFFWFYLLSLQIKSINLTNPTILASILLFVLVFKLSWEYLLHFNRPSDFTVLSKKLLKNYPSLQKFVFPPEDALY